MNIWLGSEAGTITSLRQVRLTADNGHRTSEAQLNKLRQKCAMTSPIQSLLTRVMPTLACGHVFCSVLISAISQPVLERCVMANHTFFT